MKAKIAIVGASIAGSVCAIILERLGFDITVFEKSKGNDAIVDRGAGIWLPQELINKLIDKDMLAKNFPSFGINERPIYTYDNKLDQEQLLTTHPTHGSSVNWMNLYEDLKQHRPEAKIRYDSLVTQIEDQQGMVELTINEQQRHAFDYCIFADGVYSLGRQYLFPDLKPTFTNSIIWRGTLDRIDAETTERLMGKGTFYVCKRGHLLIYLIPTKDSTKKYRINWLFYEVIDSAHELFRDNNEKARQNIIRGTMSAEYRNYLEAAAKKYFPTLPRNIILATEQPFTQAIHEMLIPSYVVNNICLIGDAGILLRPHAAVGATKAIQDALALGEQLKINADIKSALKIWNENQYDFGKKQFKLGRALGKLFVTEMPAWHQINKQQMDNMWQAVAADCWYAKKHG